MRTFLGKLVLMLPLGVAIVIFNLWVDPASLFHQAGKQQIAAYMLEGLNVTNIYHHDKRQSLRYYAAGLDEPRGTLVFGSSRPMLIDSSFFPDKTFFNAGVPGATLNDLLACYQVFYEKGLIPERVVIGLEPYMLNGRYRCDLYLKPEYRRALHRLALADLDTAAFLTRFIHRRYRELISPDYFQKSISTLPRLLNKGRPVPSPTTEPEAERRMLRADGGLVYAREVRERSREEVAQIATKLVARRPKELTWFPKLDENRIRVFETYIKSLLAEGVEVVFMLFPYHPIPYNELTKAGQFGMVCAAQEYFETFAAQHGIAVYGSYDPAQCGCDATDFYDGLHPKEGAMMRILEAGPKPPAHAWRETRTQPGPRARDPESVSYHSPARRSRNQVARKISIGR